MSRRPQRFDADALSMQMELADVKVNLAKCVCGHERYRHVDWGHDGPCSDSDCECKVFVEKS